MEWVLNTIQLESLKKEGHMNCSDKLELRYHKPRSTWGYQKLKGTRKDSPIESSEETCNSQHLDFGLLTSQL